MVIYNNVDSTYKQKMDIKIRSLYFPKPSLLPSLTLSMKMNKCILGF